jgi:transposase
MAINITALFCCLDDFCRLYETCERQKLIPRTGSRRRCGKLCLSEMLFIMVLFHVSPFKDFKHFYLHGVQGKYRELFGALPCYARFVQLMGRLLLPLAVLLHSLRGEATGIYFADSTSLRICHNRRISSNRVFAGLAKRGKTAMGWFYGFKLHIVINHKAELVAVKITPGNCDDRKPLPAMAKGLLGKLFADKGYISKVLFEQLWQDGLQLITGIRRTMRNYLMPWLDKILLRRRFLVETVFDTLKSAQGLEHTRHRSPINAFVHILSCLVAYGFRTTKPKLTTIIPIPA